MKTDITSILRLNSWAGRLVLIIYGIGTTIVAVMNLSGMIQPVAGIGALVLLWAGIILLGFITGEPLALPWTIALIVIVALTTAISAWNVLDPQNPGYATWPLGAMTILLFVLALRGRRALAWVGFLVMAVISIIVAVLTSQDVVGVITLLLRQSATLIIGSLFAIVLRRATQTIASIQSYQLSRAAVSAATELAVQERDAQNSRLEQDARPALERIISPAPFTARDLQEFAAVSATLRGGTQAAGTSGNRIADAVREARVRGLTVTLIDDLGTPLPLADRARVESSLLPLLAEVVRGSITVRLSPDSHDEIATIVVEEDGEFRRVVITGEVVASFV